ncbi:hypothetical protein SAMN05421874_12898 [Nonomuraea maritima]|uniref:Uncharacterized protein n=1 Tax=Nonomuraea maritima TaxID=683260 RepID=A0A1G9MMN6_9ACTN|nr:hypothetical protein [Nonomuraea maritima]SDL75323.1 hypothetical protein SAMN05421874_12898 [Nonomuraea maritima]
MTAPPPAHYRSAVDELVLDPVVKRMAARPPLDGEQCINSDGELQFRFLCRTAEDYFNAGGQHRGPVGAIAHALLRLRAEAALKGHCR